MGFNSGFKGLNILKSVAMLVCAEHDACKTDHWY